MDPFGGHLLPDTFGSGASGLSTSQEGDGGAPFALLNLLPSPLSFASAHAPAPAPAPGLHHGSQLLGSDGFGPSPHSLPDPHADGGMLGHTAGMGSGGGGGGGGGPALRGPLHTLGQTSFGGAFASTGYLSEYDRLQYRMGAPSAASSAGPLPLGTGHHHQQHQMQMQMQQYQYQQEPHQQQPQQYEDAAAVAAQMAYARDLAAHQHQQQRQQQQRQQQQQQRQAAQQAAQQALAAHMQSMSLSGDPYQLGPHTAPAPHQHQHQRGYSDASYSSLHSGGSSGVAPAPAPASASATSPYGMTAATAALLSTRAAQQRQQQAMQAGGAGGGAGGVYLDGTSDYGTRSPQQLHGQQQQQSQQQQQQYGGMHVPSTAVLDRLDRLERAERERERERERGAAAAAAATAAAAAAATLSGPADFRLSADAERYYPAAAPAANPWQRDGSDGGGYLGSQHLGARYGSGSGSGSGAASPPPAATAGLPPYALTTAEMSGWAGPSLGRVSPPASPPAPLATSIATSPPGARAGGSTSGGASNNTLMLPPPEARVAFRERQWQVLRLLLVRRYAQATGNPGHAALTPANIRAAATLFDVPLTVSTLVSKPHRYSINDGSSGSGGGAAALALVGMFDADLPDADLSEPTSVAVTARDLEPYAASLGGGPLPEDALGWDGSDGFGGGGGGGGRKRSDGSEGGGAGASSSSSVLTGTASTADAHGSLAPPSATSPSPASSGTGSGSGTSAADQFAAACLLADMAVQLVSLKRFKTKLCHAWLRTGGRCPRGSACDFAHGAAELRTNSATKGPKYKMRLCRVWLDTCAAYCPHGHRCSFAHGCQELRIRLQAPALGPPPAPPAPAASSSSSSTSSSSYSVASLVPHTHSGELSPYDTGMTTSSSSASTQSTPSAHSLMSLSPMSTAMSSGGPGAGHGAAGPAAAAAAGGGGGGGGGFLPQLCKAWLQGAAHTGAALALRMAATDGPSDATISELCERMSAAGDAACRAQAQARVVGGGCRWAHGCSQLRLPTAGDFARAVHLLISEPPATPVHDPDSASSPAEDAGGLSTREQTLVLLGSGLLAGALPSQLFHRVSVLAQGSNNLPPPSVVSSFFADLPFSIGSSLTFAVESKMLAVLLPHFSKPAAVAPSRAGFNAYAAANTAAMDQQRYNLSRVFAVVSNEAADAALVAAAIALGLARPTIAPDLLAAAAAAAAAAASSSYGPSTSGRYGNLLRRRTAAFAAPAASISAGPSVLWQQHQQQQHQHYQHQQQHYQQHLLGGGGGPAY